MTFSLTPVTVRQDDERDQAEPGERFDVSRILLVGECRQIRAGEGGASGNAGVRQVPAGHAPGDHAIELSSSGVFKQVDGVSAADDDEISRFDGRPDFLRTCFGQVQSRYADPGLEDGLLGELYEAAPRAGDWRRWE